MIKMIWDDEIQTCMLEYFLSLASNKTKTNGLFIKTAIKEMLLLYASNLM